MPINIVSEMHTGTLPDVNSTQLFFMDVERFLDSLPQEPIFDLVVTSPPYNIGKEYENQVPLTDYVAWQKRIIEKIYPRLKETGSIRKTSGITTMALSLFAMITSLKRIAFLSGTFL